MVELVPADDPPNTGGCLQDGVWCTGWCWKGLSISLKSFVCMLHFVIKIGGVTFIWSQGFRKPLNFQICQKNWILLGHKGRHAQYQEGATHDQKERGGIPTSQTIFIFTEVIHCGSCWHLQIVIFIGKPVFKRFVDDGSSNHDSNRRPPWNFSSDTGVHFSLDVLPSWADRGSCAHKCVCQNF